MLVEPPEDSCFEFFVADLDVRKPVADAVQLARGKPGRYLIQVRLQAGHRFRDALDKLHDRLLLLVQSLRLEEHGCTGRICLGATL